MSNNNDNSADHKPFREYNQPPPGITPLTETNLAPVGFPHVAFAARSPSIIPTPVYDDTSSIEYTPLSSPALSSITSPSVVPASPSPLSKVINEGEQGSPVSPSKHVYGSKVEVAREDNNNASVYGPTFRDDDELQQYDLNSVSTSSAFNQGDFVAVKEDTEKIQLYESQTKPLFQQPPPPEKTRVDIFMNKLKGYQNPLDSSITMEPEDEEQRRRSYNNFNTKSFKRHGDDDEIVRHMPEQRSLVYRQLFGSTRYPIFTWISAIAMLGVFIFELVRNDQLSGSWIQTNPFNPMVGPNYMALVNMGSKFAPCMRETTQYPPTSVFGNCYQSTESTCTVEELCGFGGFGGQAPDQTYRFVLAIFLHAGVIHILLNLLTQLQFGSQIERSLGLVRFILLYFVTGIFGFVLSGVLSGLTSSSMGCSGALFGLVGYSVTDIIMRWKEMKRPGRELTILLFSSIIALVLGLFPGIDNFAHIGGFVMGLLFGVVLSSLSPLASRRAVIITWIAKVIALAAAVILYVVFLRIFYTSSDLSTVCPNCKYLSCLPVNDWCDI